MLKVKIIRHTPEPEKTVAAAARLCYSPIGAMELDEIMTDSEVKNLVNKLISMGHLSAIEHASFTFAVEGISRACSHQLVRHRLASYSQQSQRYVQFEEKPVFIEPPELKGEELENFRTSINKAFEVYYELVNNGIDPEDARYVLPQAIETKIVMTMNARELLHFFKLRCCNRAQWEIRYLAIEMLRLAREKAPVIFHRAGPGCYSKKCEEGKMSCGEPWQRLKEILPVNNKGGVNAGA